MKKRTTIAVLALQLVSWGAHFGLVEHDVCAAHGDLIHATERHVDDPLRRVFDAAPAVDFDHEHDACTAWQSLERTSDCPVVAMEAPPRHVVGAGPAGRQLAIITPLGLAPKTSPPA